MEQYTCNADWSKEFIEPIKPSNDHSVLVEWPIAVDEDGVPRPQAGRNHWNSNFVRLPCHPESQISIKDVDGKEIIKSRWEVIQEAFIKPIKNSRDFESAVLSYNENQRGKWKFYALHDLFEEELEEEEAEVFFNHTFPKIVQLALRLSELIQWSIPLLRQHHNKSVTLSQLQIGSLLANAFLCTFPRRNDTHRAKHEYATYPDINFARLFGSRGDAVMHKIKCICHYFRRITRSPPTGLMTFTRRCCNSKDFPNWEKMQIPLSATELNVFSTGTIEDADGLMQVDFANKYLGGGVLGYGCVQEEIRFVICPELLISKLFTEELKNNEALIMTGCERYCRYTGYASSFQFAGNFVDETPFDSSRRRKCCITAIDALHFRHGSHQFRQELMIRELNKAYVGFFYDLYSTPPPIASGNWGCGAFGGEPLLKSLLQLMVCTAINRPLVYFTFGNEELKDDIEKMYKFLRDNEITISQLWSYLCQFTKHKLHPGELYSFIYQCFYDGKVTNAPEMEDPVNGASTSKHSPSPKLQEPTTSGAEKLRKSPKKESKPNTLLSYFSKTKTKSQAQTEEHLETSFDSVESVDHLNETVLRIEESPPQVEGTSGLSLMNALNSDYHSGAVGNVNNDEERYPPAQKTSGLSLLDALNSDYYSGSKAEEEPYPPKRVCMETSD